MLHDQLAIDGFNPFATFDFQMPGTWSDPYPYSKLQIKPPKVEEDPALQKSPICDYGITAGDRTIDMCDPIKPNCPMTRPLEPQRLIDPGMWNYYLKSAGKKKIGAFSIFEDDFEECLFRSLVVLIILYMIMRSIRK